MIDINIDNYLTEDKLRKTLQKIIGLENWIGNEVKVPNTRKRWDMSFKYNDKIYIVEFDGEGHYRDSLLIKSDHEKDAIASSLNFHTIRIPYFVQLTNDTFHYYFPFIDKDINIHQDFKHGFIATKHFPASFCKLGLDKYYYQLNNLPSNVIVSIQESLRDRILDYGVLYVL